MAARKTTTPNPNNIPEEGIELLPLEESTVPDTAAATPETAPAPPPLNADNAATAPAYGQNTSAPAPAPAAAPAVKATTVSGAPLWIAGSLLAAGGGIAVAAKGGSSDNKNSDHHNNQSNHGDNSLNPPPAQPVANHVRLIYDKDSQAQIQTLGKWQDNLLHLGKKLTVDDVPENNILAQYTQKHGATKVQSNIRQAYLPDSDGDGIIDHHDNNPAVWDVSDRDLRMFATLAYEGPEALSNIFDEKSDYSIQSVGSDPKFFNGATDPRELVEHWQLLKAYNGHDLFGTGLDYAVFGNGKTANGYQNVVVAFRGTSNVGDLIADAKLAVGARPSQVFELSEEVMTDLARFNPERVYSTGHSLGGYLAQYFAAYNMGNNKAFQHSALFNPAILKTGLLSSSDLKEARRLTDRWLTRETDLDHADKSDPKQITKTTSFVITGEWLSNVFGSYDKTTWVSAKADNQESKHAMANFYTEDSEIRQHFSSGYRTDKYYENQDDDGDGLSYSQEKHLGLNVGKNDNQTDTDRDGFSDALEVKVGSDRFNAEIDIDLRDYYNIKANEKVIFAVAGKETVEGNLLEALGVELSAQVQDNQLVYTPSGTPPITLGINNTEWAQWLAHSKIIINGTQEGDTLAGIQDKAAILYGAAGDDVLAAGSGLDVMVGGTGNDTFRFSADKLNRDGSADVISDFSAGDRLDLNGMRSLFTDHGKTFRFADILSDSHSPLFTKHSALVWNGGERTLSYKTAGSDTLHAFVRFDDEQSFNAIQTGLLA